MNIAHILSNTARFPLKKHHGRYQWAFNLAKKQAALGHKVYIYAHCENKKVLDKIHMQGTHQHSYQDKKFYNLELISKAIKNEDHDIIHSHLDYQHFFLAGETKKNIVYTQHWPVSKELLFMVKNFKHKNVFALPLTLFQEKLNKKLGLPTLPFIYHGIDLEEFNFNLKNKSDRFIFVGRITPHKGVKELVYMAKQADIKLDLIGKLNESDAAYWDSCKEFVDGDQIRYLGPKKLPQLKALFKNAKAFLFPVQREEPFGLVIIESQASGTPVVIFNKGAASELVVDGKTGFVVNTEAEFIHSIGKIDQIQRKACRKNAEKFDVNEMVNHYLKTYKTLI